MKLSVETVAKVAKLSALNIPTVELEHYTAQLEKILTYIDTIETADTTDVKPTFNVSSNLNVMADDKAESSLFQAEAVANGTDIEKGYFVTKGVFEND